MANKRKKKMSKPELVEVMSEDEFLRRERAEIVNARIFITLGLIGFWVCVGLFVVFIVL